MDKPAEEKHRRVFLQGLKPIYLYTFTLGLKPRPTKERVLPARRRGRRPGCFDTWTAAWLLMALLLPGPLCAQTPTPAEAMALEREGRLPEAAAAWKSVTRHNP